jgi:MFS family permease
VTFVYALANAPRIGWANARTIAELAAAVLLMGAFVANELRRSNPLFPLSIFKVKGLAAADVTQVIAQAGFLSLFFFITLYVQTVLHMSPIQAGAAYIPVTVGVGISSGISTQLLPRIGSRPLIVAGTLIGAAGVFLLSGIAADGSYVADVLPGLVVMALGLGAVFVGVQNAANAGVPAEQAGLAAALISASATLGGALGLAILSAISTSRTHHLLAAHASHPVALTSGFGYALHVCSLFLVAATVIAARTASTRGQHVANVEPAAELTAA